MKKKEFTELIRLSLIKDVNPLVVDKYVSMAYDSYVQGYWMSIKGGSLDVFTKLFEGVEIRNEGKQYYSDLPASLIDLPRTGVYRDWETDRKSTRLNSSHSAKSRMPSSA